MSRESTNDGATRDSAASKPGIKSLCANIDPAVLPPAITTDALKSLVTTRLAAMASQMAIGRHDGASTSNAPHHGSMPSAVPQSGRTIGHHGRMSLSVPLAG